MKIKDNSVLLFGINELSERIDFYMTTGNSKFPTLSHGFVVDDEYYEKTSFSGKPIYPYSDAKSLFMEKIPILVCIGYKKMNRNREKIFLRLLNDGWKIGQYVSSNATINTTNIGIGNIILGSSTIEVKSKIGDGNIFDGGHASHHSVIGNFNYFVSNVMGGHVVVDNNCFLGMQSCLKDGIHIKSNTFIGANCYMNHSTKQDGFAYVSPKPVKLGFSEDVIEFWN